MGLGVVAVGVTDGVCSLPSALCAFPRPDAVCACSGHFWQVESNSRYIGSLSAPGHTIMLLRVPHPPVFCSPLVVPCWHSWIGCRQLQAIARHTITIATSARR